MLNGLSVVIPAYNEEANIAKCLRSIDRIIQKLKIQDYEIIVVNDGSKDHTGKIAKSFLGKIANLIVVENRPNRGYGGALKAGFAAATNNLIAFIPADNQFDISELPGMVAKLEAEKADMVSGIRVSDSDPVHRKFVRWLWNTGIRALFGYLASDIDCGFKIFKREVLKRISIPSNGAMIDTQLLAGMRARGMKITEMPVTHLPRTAGTATGGNLKVWIKAWRELAIFWWQLKQEILVEQGRAVFRWEALIIAAILVVAGVVRLYRIDQYMTFLGDEGRDVLAVRDMLLGRKFTLIGPGTSIGDMYLGPWYYYMMLLPLAVTNFHPVGPAIQVALLSVATVGLLWWVGRQWHGRSAALLMAGLYSLSPLVVTSSRSSWNPNIMPFFALLAMYAVWKVWRFGYWRWLVIAAASFAMVLNSHYLGLLLLPVILLFWFLSPKRPEARRYTLISVVVFAAMMSPLVLFDVRHGWNNFSAMREFFANRQTTVNLKVYKALPNVVPIWVDMIAGLLTARNQIVAVFLAVALPILLVWRSKTRRINRDLVFTSAWVGAGLIGLGLYKQHIYDHYYGFMFPAIFLLTGFALESLRRWMYVPVVVLMVLMLINSPLRYEPNYQWQRTQQVAEVIVKDANQQPFNLALLAKRNYDKSYRYALTLAPANYYPMRDELTGKLQMTDLLYVVCEDPVCQPLGNPLWEIASFGWAKIDRQWEFPWGVKLYKLVHNPDGK